MDPITESEDVESASGDAGQGGGVTFTIGAEVQTVEAEEAEGADGEDGGGQDMEQKESSLERRRSMRQSRMSTANSSVFEEEIQRRQSRKTIQEARLLGEVIKTADLASEIKFSAGIIVDYMERRRGYDPKGMRLASMLNKMQIADLRGYQFAAMVICRDGLKMSLLEHIIQESKERAMFEKLKLKDWKHWVFFIKKMKRETACLTVDVKILQMQERAKRLVARDFPPSAAESMGRMDEFWHSYRDRHRVVSDRPAAKPTPTRPKFGMVWDVQRGPTWRMLNPSPGTLQQKEVAKMEREAGVGEGGHRGMGYKSRSTPNLTKPPPSREATLGQSKLRPGLLDPHSPNAGRFAQREILPPIQNRHHYLKACDKQNKVPIPLTFATGHSKVFSAEGRNLVDKELLAMSGMVKEMEKVEEVNLFDNSLLSDGCLASFLRQLQQETIAESLQKLNLGRCPRAGLHTVTTTTSVLKECLSLQELNLSQIPISTKLQVALAQAIGKHPAIQKVNLSETGLMPNDLTTQCIMKILSSNTLHTLDLSWNCFDGEVFKSLGENVVYSKGLRTLKVANCSGQTDVRPAQDAVPPLSLFLEQLSKDKSLTSLDISLNRCDFRTALILEDSLDSHKNLRELILCENPLGVLGVRSILRLLCRDHTGLVSFNMEACYGGKVVVMGGRDPPIFSYTNPGGKYDLQLWRPYDRALLRMLYKMTDRFGLPKEEAFDKIAYRKGSTPLPYQHPEKDNVGVWQVPDEGELTLAFSVERAIFKKFMSVGQHKIEDSDFEGFMTSYLNQMRFTPGFKKVIPLFASWADLEEDEIAQFVYLDALSKDFNLTLSHLQYMVNNSGEIGKETIMRLQHCVPGDDATEYLSSQMFLTLDDLAWAQRQTINLIDFNIGNPTGHYKLDLSNCSDYAVAERLLLLDRWEAAVDRKHERRDVSQLGNGTHLRNPIYQGRSVHASFHSVADWKLPEHGEFEVDFMSNQHPPKGVSVLSDELWEKLLMDMFSSSCTPEDKIVAMRAISHTFWITSAHTRSMLGYFRLENERADIFIIFFGRIVDLHNAKMFRVRFMSQQEVVRLQERLGYASFFPFFQPENARFELNLAKNDQRLCACMFVQLCTKEKFPHNLHDYGYKLPDGTEDPMPLGVPRSWASFDTIPKEGVFRARYMCAPEYRNFAFRKEIATQFGFYNGVEDLEPEDVKWWTGLMEPPEDVINLLEYFISRYDDVSQPFLDIDGVDGNGVITLKELVEGLDEMGCEKFNKKKGSSETRTKDQRIEAIFRYMDQGEEGSVSIEEWNILQQLWNEFDLSIKEFVHFLILSYGEDLLDAWEALDADGSGEMDEQEWLEAVHGIGYFGPATVVFALLDASDDGNISWDEFEVLEKYKPEKYQSRPVSRERSRPASREQSAK